MKLIILPASWDGIAYLAGLCKYIQVTSSRKRTGVLLDLAYCGRRGTGYIGLYSHYWWVHDILEV
jgi:hypothetical protein